MSIKIAVIGGGLGGYPAAIRAARMGAHVTLVEKRELGGVCLHEGCIPTKAFLQSAELYSKINNSSDFGVNIEGVSYDYKSILERKNRIIYQLVNGVKLLIKSKKINYVPGEATILAPGKVLIKGTGKVIEVDKIIIATGSIPSKLPASLANEEDILYSDKVLNINKLPNEVLIIGGGVIGVEFAQFFSMLGKKVTIIEQLPRIIATEDKDISQAMTDILKKENKINIINNATIQEIRSLGEIKEVIYSKDNVTESLKVDMVIGATGRKPFTTGLGLEQLEVEYDKNGIKVNDKMETNIKDIYAAGDVVGGIMLAHVAAAEGECAAKNALGVSSVINYNNIPKCIYTKPEIASVGLNEEEASRNYDIKVGKFPFYANGKALIMNETGGMVKIIADKKYGEILGAQIIGPQATNLISEIVLAMHLEATVEEVANAIHPHPSLSEAIMEAAMSLGEGAIHLP